jgi:hypothetical protein
VHFMGAGIAQSVYRLGYGLENRDSVPGGVSDGKFLFSTASRPAVGPTRPPIQRVLGALSLGVKLTIQVHLVPKLGMRGAVPPLSQYVFMP